MDDKKPIQSYTEYIQHYFPSQTTDRSPIVDHRIIGQQYALKSIEAVVSKNLAVNTAARI